MTTFEIRLRIMLRSIFALRWRQTRWVLTEYGRLFGLVPSSGKWTERVSFIYIYILIIGLLTPSVVNTLGGLYGAEAKTSPALQATILYTTIPWVVAVFSVILIVMPWKAWLLRLTFGDMTYLSPSPFDRRVLSIWRYLEMVAVIPVLAFVPLVLVAPMFGSIWAQDVIPNVLRGMMAIGLWVTMLLALGWHVSLQQYARVPLPSGISLIARLGVVVAAGALAVTKPDLLLWPGRLIVLLALDKVSWGWPLLIAGVLIGTVVVWRAATHLSLTRASAGSDVFARIQQLGFMVFMDRQLLFSILSEARANEGYAVGTLAPTMGLATVFARSALHYRRRVGQAVQLFVAGIALGLALIVWRPTNPAIVIITAVLLAWLLPPWMAQLFRRDLTVPFMSQFVPQPLTRRLLASSVVPVVLMLAGMIPVVFSFGGWMPGWAWGLVPAVWVISLFGHVEVVGKGSMPAERTLFSVLLGSVVLFAVLWSVTSSNITGYLSLLPGITVSASATLALIFVADFRHNGIPTS